MQLRLTPYALRALRLARLQAGRCGKEAVSPEHLLAALLERGDNMACRVLQRTSALPDRVLSALTVFLRERPGGSEEPELSLEVRRIVTCAYQEAERLGDRRVGTDHLLLGVLAETESLAATVLLGMEADAERLREEVGHLRSLGGGAESLAHAAGDAPPVSPDSECPDS